MKKYLVKYGGSVGVRPIEFDQEERDLDRLAEYVERNLRNYWPAYYQCYAWEYGKPGAPVLHMKSDIAVKRIES